MSVAAPLFLWIASAVALATVAAHLLAWRRPPASPFPTARFAPDRPARVVSRTVRPTDLLLLAVRVALVMLVGIALARPTFTPHRRGNARVIVVDRSRSAADAAVVSDTARSVFRAGDVLVVFDSVAREVQGATADSVTATEEAARQTRARGSVSAALVVAVRAATRLARERDSVEVVVVSPLTADELDAATSAIRNQWAGPLRVMRTGFASAGPRGAAQPTVWASAGDPVAAALSLVGPVAGGARVRVRRDALTPEDSVWAEGGGTVVIWPVTPGADGWTSRAAADTAFAVVASSRAGPVSGGGGGLAAVVAPFERRVSPPAGRAAARWGDGEPAATEIALGSGCVRAVAVVVPAVGDLVLTPAFRHFARRMVEPCVDRTDLELLPDSVVTAVLSQQSGAPGAAGTGNERAASEPGGVASWLLGVALVLAISELFLRRGGAYAAA